MTLPENGRDEGRDERSGVDCKVENGEECLQLPLLLRKLELVAAERGDARLDAAGAGGDQGQADQRELAGMDKTRRDQKRPFLGFPVQLKHSFE